MKTYKQFLERSMNESFLGSNPKFRPFTKTDYYGFAGASNKPDGTPPTMHEGSHGLVIHSGDGEGMYHIEAHHAGEQFGGFAQEFKHAHHADEFANKAAHVMNTEPDYEAAKQKLTDLGFEHL